MEQHRNSLQPGYQLHWYRIEQILGQGGFGITYLAHDTNLKQQVAIKEYLPVELAVREKNISVHPVSGEHGIQYNWGLERFINEAQTLARFKHPNIVRVLTIFRENNTAYMVMEYEQGRPLHEILKAKKTLDEEELKKIILPVMEGLQAVHAENFIHRDIKPPNIYIREDGSPVLLDFGSARQSLAEQTLTMTAMVSPGYAPFEQYVSNSKKQGPWSDIYGLGATLYRAVTGISPPDSMNRSEAILHTGKDIYVPAAEIVPGKYSPQLIAAIDHAMAFKPEDRPQNLESWRSEMEGNYQVKAESSPVTNPGSETVTEKVERVNHSQTLPAARGKPAKIMTAVGIGLLVILVLIAVNHKIKKTNAEWRDAAATADVTAQKPEEVKLPAEEVKPAEPELAPPPSARQQVIADKPVITETEGAVPEQERKRLQRLRDRVRSQPGDQTVREEVKSTAARIDAAIKKALENGDYQLARNYINELKTVMADNPRAQKRLDELLNNIELREKQAKAR